MKWPSASRSRSAPALARGHGRPDLVADRDGQHPSLDELEVGEGTADDDGRRGQGIVDLRQ